MPTTTSPSSAPALPDIPVVKIQRDFQDAACTQGTIHLPNGKILHTLERPWMMNRTGISCIPAGKYRAIWTRSPKLGRYTYELIGVPGRFAIRVHPANWPQELEGCIALGLKRGLHMISESRAALAAFEEAYATHSLIFDIYDVPHK